MVVVVAVVVVVFACLVEVLFSFIESYGCDTFSFIFRSQIDYLVGEACDKFVRADSVFNTGGIGFIVPKGAQYLDAFNSM